MNIREYIIVLGGYIARACTHVIAEGYLFSNNLFCYDPETGQEYKVTTEESDDWTSVSMQQVKDQGFVTYVEVTNDELRENMNQVRSDVRNALLHPQDEHEKKVALDALRDLNKDILLPVWDYDKIPAYLYTTVINHVDELTDYFCTII